MKKKQTIDSKLVNGFMNILNASTFHLDCFLFKAGFMEKGQ